MMLAAEKGHLKICKALANKHADVTWYSGETHGKSQRLGIKANAKSVMGLSLRKRWVWRMEV